MKLTRKTIFAAAALSGLLVGCSTTPKTACKGSACKASAGDKAGCGSKSDCSSKSSCKAKGNCSTKSSN